MFSFSFFIHLFRSTLFSIIFVFHGNFSLRSTYVCSVYFFRFCFLCWRNVLDRGFFLMSTFVLVDSFLWYSLTPSRDLKKVITSHFVVLLPSSQIYFSFGTKCVGFRFFFSDLFLFWMVSLLSDLFFHVYYSMDIFFSDLPFFWLMFCSESLEQLDE